MTQGRPIDANIRRYIDDTVEEIFEERFAEFEQRIQHLELQDTQNQISSLFERLDTVERLTTALNLSVDYYTVMVTLDFKHRTGQVTQPVFSDALFNLQHYYSSANGELNGKTPPAKVYQTFRDGLTESLAKLGLDEILP